MKKLILLTLITLGAAADLLAQGTVTFESEFQANSIILNGNPAPAMTYQVALLYAAGTSPVPQSSLYLAIVFTANFTGYFYDGTTVDIPVNGPAGGGAAVFEVQAWTGNFASYAAAAAGGAWIGQSTEFVNNMGNPNPPATAPVETTGFNGSIIMGTPEPGTISLGVFGTAALWLFRRRK